MFCIDHVLQVVVAAHCEEFIWANTIKWQADRNMSKVSPLCDGSPAFS